MNRKYSREQYLDCIKKIRTRVPGIALGTDIIVGFSGETAEQFEETLSLYREVQFDISYNAQYSQRSGTLAVKLYVDDVPAEEKRRRWDVLHTLMAETAEAKNARYIGQETLVLVEKVEAGLAIGTNREYKVCRFPSTDDSLVGKQVPVRIARVKTWVLDGQQQEKHAQAGV